MLLEVGKPLIARACNDWWSYNVNLCLADATRSRAPDGANLCEVHGGMYQRRLESLACPNIDRPHLVMTVTTSDEARANSERLTRSPGVLLDTVCMFHHFHGWFETSRPEQFDRHGVFVEGSATDFQGVPDAVALSPPARISELLIEPEPVFL